MFLSRFICLFTWGLGEGVDGEKLATGRYRHGFKLAESVPIYAFAECILMEMIFDCGGGKGGKVGNLVWLNCLESCTNMYCIVGVLRKTKSGDKGEKMWRLMRKNE